MKKMTKIIALLLLVAFSLVLTSASFEMPENENKTTDSWMKKMSPSLWNIYNSSADDDIIPLLVQIKSVGDAVIRERILLDSGMNPDIYENESLFQKYVVEKIIEEFESDGSEIDKKTEQNESREYFEYDKSESVLDSDYYDCVSEENYGESKKYDPLIEQAIFQKRDEYFRAKLSAMRIEETKKIEEFISKNVDQSKCEVIDYGASTGVIFIKAPKSEIKKFALNDAVGIIAYNSPDYITYSTLNTASSQVGFDETAAGTHGSNYNGGSGFLGNGIRIGIIESGGVMDTASPHFNNNLMTNLSNGNNSTNVSTHASLVTSIISGRRVIHNGQIYSGVVPNAQTFIIRALNYTAFRAALIALENEEVHVINVSLGFSNTDSYGEIDAFLDDFIARTGITVVVAAGNNGSGFGDNSTRLSSPAYALNCISVGNAQTKTSATGSASNSL